MTFEHKRIYTGPHNQPYAQDQINAAGAEGWELVQIMEHDAWVKRQISPAMQQPLMRGSDENSSRIDSQLTALNDLIFAVDNHAKVFSLSGLLESSLKEAKAAVAGE